MSKTRTPINGPVAPLCDSVGHRACEGGLDWGLSEVLWDEVSGMVFRLDFVDCYF
jgi:hypothetical protein